MEKIESLYCASSKIAGIHFKVFASHKGIRHVFINKEEGTVESHDLINLHFDDPFLFNVFGELSEYFNGKRKIFSVPLDLHGTDFQIKVWHELIKIPFGKVISYKTLSLKLGDEKLMRAVGRANGTNPVPVIVPCHRVINSDGTLGGYSAGIGIKKQLLELEGALSMELF